MGRVGNNEQQVQETIDDSFPESEQAAAKPRSLAPSSNTAPQPSPPHKQQRDEDLYYVPSQQDNYHQHQTSSNAVPQANRPHKQQREEEDLYYVSSQAHYHQHQTAASFPPQGNEYQLPSYHQHVPPQPNVHYAHQMPPPSGGVQHGVPQMGHPVMAAPPVRPLDVNSYNAPQDKAWSSELFDCMNDPENALTTAFFPCVTFGQIAEIVDSGNTTCTTSGVMYGAIMFCIAMPCIMSCTYRTKMRAKFGLMELPAQDWVVHFFCEWCALCQEYRQLKSLGYDPAIGWQGNQAKMGQQQNQQYVMTPPAGQRMNMM